MMAVRQKNMKIIIETPSDAMNSLNEQRTTGQYCDLILQSLDGVEFQAHKSYLAARAKYFANMLNVDSGFKESTAEVVQLKGFDAETLGIVLDYIYVGAIEINFNNVMGALQAFDLLILDKAVGEIDATLSSIAVEYTEEVLEIVTGFSGLPKTEEIIAKQICALEGMENRSEYVKRSLISGRITVDLMCKIVKTGGAKCNDLFQEILLWLQKKGEEGEVNRVYQNMDFSSLSTTNLRKLVNFGMNQLEGKTNVGLIYKKMDDLFVSSRSGVVRHTFRMHYMNGGRAFSNYHIVGNLRWQISAQTVGVLQLRNVGVYIWCRPEQRKVHNWKCLVNCTFKLLSKTGVALEHVMERITCSGGDENLGENGNPAFVSWESLHDPAKGFLFGNSIDLEAHICIESFDAGLMCK